ncbi:hypothetical protein STRTUCAR8_08565 [Streptomyces turgidiscabies Car8]|uniref:Uncharacterized protein n=1 Tax=Streptomyces turgidiscabies (strain Car8) TaxID=698760 RepID=L7F8V5_STRT8|nr:hypothetical protein [Streptomyces turgidiscabies]ELP67642.1 hypothetical protein STRTUCAR8_08565 [Streptomyces turgidiscabies Car8]
MTKSLDEASEDVETPAEGIAATYEVTFTPAEAKRVRRAARDAGQTVCAYLHSLAVNRDSHMTMNVVINGGLSDKEAARRAIAHEIQRALATPHGRFHR